MRLAIPIPPKPSMKSPFLHGIAIGLMLALLFPQASLARQDTTQTQSDAMYDVLSGLSLQLACTIDTAKHACGENAITFELLGGPAPQPGQYPAISNEGHNVTVTISKFYPVVDNPGDVESIPAGEALSIYQDEVSHIEGEMLAAAESAKHEYAIDNGLDPTSVQLPALPEMPETLSAFTESFGSAFAIIDGGSNIVYAELLISRVQLENAYITRALPIQEL